jgi:hypothetical protein
MANRAVGLGVTMGVFGIAGVYLGVTLLPPFFGILIPIGGLAIPILFFWPRWFDREGEHWQKRGLRRLGALAIAAPVAAAISFLLALTTPYIAWSEDVHRDSLQRQGKSDTEITAALEQHRAVPADFVFEGLILTVVPGVIASLVTLGAGAIVWRRRAVRSDARAAATPLRRY